MDFVAENITVTHYINPHCFWYKPTVACMPEHEQQLFSFKLNDKCVALYGGQFILARTARGPSAAEIPGNVVAVYNTVHQHWNRCVVDEVVICIGNKRIYRLWALDEGVPIQSSPEYVRPLPEEFKSEPAHAKRGALMNVFPLEPKNYSLEDAPWRMGNQWYAGAVSSMKTLLEMGLSVSMVVRAQIVVHGELVHFGDMTIKSNDNQECNVSQFLCNNGPQQVDQRISDPIFFNRILKLQTLRVSRYQTNEGIDNTIKQISWMKNNPRHRDVSPLLQMDVPQDGFSNAREEGPHMYIVPAGQSPVPHNLRKLREAIKKRRAEVPKATQTNSAPAGDVKEILEISDIDTKIFPTTAEQGKPSEEPPTRLLNYIPAGYSIERALANLRMQANNKS